MKTQSDGTSATGHPRVAPHRSLVLTALVSLDAFALGGLVALLIVNRLLTGQLDQYAAAQSMAAASAILDFMDNLLPFLFAYSLILLVLVLATLGAWAWFTIVSRRLRYGVILLCLAVIVLLASLWFLGGAAGPTIPPATPTPVPSTAGEWERGL